MHTNTCTAETHRATEQTAGTGRRWTRTWNDVLVRVEFLIDEACYKVDLGIRGKQRFHALAKGEG